MSAEHSTPIGTPVVIAPGKVFLVGEYAVLDDGHAAVAAITMHAQAQFIPRMEAMPPMVSELVRRTLADLGEAAAALPPGGVLATTEDFRHGFATSGLGSSAAIAVATVGAVFESLGLALEDHGPQILALADGGRRAVQGDVGSGADMFAAAHGGLTIITRHRDAQPKLEHQTPPAGLHLVLFSAGPSISTRQMTAGLRTYARHEPAAFERGMTNLRQISQRFVDEVSAGQATGAVVAAGKYGEELARLAAAASVPILTDAFIQAAERAQQFGGVAKPIGAGGGGIGIALFATPEAAQLFKKACPPTLTLIDGDIDSRGVRCQSPGKAPDDFADAGDTVASSFLDEDESVAIQLFEPMEQQAPAARILDPAQEIATAPVRGPEQRPEPGIGPSESSKASKPRAHLLRRRILPVVAILLAAAATWFAFPKPAVDHGPGVNSIGAAIADAPPIAPLVVRPEQTTHLAAPEAKADRTQPPTPPVPASIRQPGHAPHRRPGAAIHKPEPTRKVRVAPVPPPAKGSAPAPSTRPAPSRRAGNLSPEDF